MSRDFRTAADEDSSFETNLQATLAAVYPELRRIARGMMSRERAAHTLQATALANEVVARLLKRELDGEDRGTIVAWGIREMQRILIDSGRRQQFRKRNGLAAANSGGGEFAAVESIAAGDGSSLEAVIHLQLCLERLGEVDPRARQVVELRFFTGLTIAQTAELLGVSARSVVEDWEFARCWLAQHWADQDPSPAAQ